MEEPDRVLLEKYRRGDLGALETLVAKHRRTLFGFILNITGKAGDADDVFQEVWLKVIRKLGTYRENNFPGWLVRIARNTVIDRSRRRKPDLSLDSAPEEGRSMAEIIPGKDPGPRRNLEAGDIGRRIAGAVAGLPAEQKEVFVLRVQADMPFKDIARVQKVSINTALARMQYALEKLRSLLKEDYKDLAKEHISGRY